MPKDVIITPASGLIDFQGNTGISSATIQLDDNGNLNIANPSGDLTIGSADRDVYIGDGINSVDIIYEQSGDIRALTGKTLSIGQTDSYVRIAGQLLGEIDVIEGPLLIGTGTSTITANQRLQVTGGAYVSGSVGIGTTNPTSTLQVSGTFYNSGIGTFANGNTTYGTGSASSLELGLNNTNNAGTLKLWGATSNAYGLIQATTQNLHIDTVVGATYLNYYDGDFISFGTGASGESARFTGSTGTLTLGTITPTGTANQKLQVTGGGYFSSSVGIGTTNPVNNLQVFGGITAGNATSSTLQSGYSILRPNDSTPRTFAIVEDDTNLRIGGGAWNSVNIRTAPSNDVRVAITSSGNVGIGTTNPGQLVDVRGGLLSVSNSQSQLLIHAATNTPTVIHRNDGSDYYVLLTNNSASPNTTWNGLRPLSITLSSGRLNSINGQYFDGTTLIGTATSTGTANQKLQVIGGAYISSNVGVGTTNPSYTLTVTDTGTPATSSLTNCLADFTTTANSYGQINLRNTSSGTNASSDIIVTADNGSDTTNFIDLGINNSGFSVGSWTINGANDGYLYTSDGNLGIGAINASVAKYISFFTGGTLISNERMRISSTGVAIGTTQETGTASQLLQVAGGAYVSGNLGIGTTNPASKLHIYNGNIIVENTAPGSLEGPYIDFRETGFNDRFGVFADFGGIGDDNKLHLTANSSGAVPQTSDAKVTLLPSGAFLIGSVTPTGTTSQLLQVTGGAYVSGNLGIGTINPSQPLHVQGNARVTGAVYDSTNSPGTSGQVLQSTVTGTQWTTAAAGGSGTFDTGITTSVYISAISGLGTNTTTNNDIFVGPGVAGTSFGIGLSFPSTASREYVIESIHVTNTYSNELYLNARHDFNTGSNAWRAVPIAQRLVVPYQGSVELINQPMVANPQDHLRFQAMAGVGATATGVDGGLDVFTVYSTKTDTNFVGVGSTVASTSGAEVYRSTTYPSVIQSIRLSNYNLNIDVDASVSIYRGGTSGGIVTTGVRLGYLVYNMTIPKNSIVEILEKPKYLAVNDTIVAVGSTINSLSACVSAKLITS